MNGTYESFSQLVRCCRILTLAAAAAIGIAGRADAGPVTLFVSDSVDNVIHRFDAATGAAILPDIALGFSTGLATGPNGDLFAATNNPSSVYRYDAMTGAQIGVGPFVPFNGQNDGHDTQGPNGMAFSPSGNLYIADTTLSNVHEYDAAGNSVTSLGADPSAFFTQPTDVAFDAAGDLYVVNAGIADVLKSSGGTSQFTQFVSPLSGGLTIPWALTFGPDGKLYVLDVSNSSGPAIRRYTAAGADDGVFIGYASTTFQPNDLAFGPDGKLYVSGIDLGGTGNGEILRYLANGASDGALVTTGTSYPTFMAFSGVPEPASITMMVMAGIALFARAVWHKRTFANV